VIDILTSVFSILGLGFLLGLEHAFDVDHVVAVSSLVSEHKKMRKASLLGSFWGLGHTTTLLIAGLMVLILKVAISDKIALSLEFLVGVMIVVLGIMVLKGLFIEKKHIHRHTHNGIPHMHVHSHKHSDSHKHYHKSFLVGIIHGLAGSASLMLLVLSTIESIYLGIIFILIFGLGTILGMSVVAGMISFPFTFTAKNFSLWNKRIRYLTGVFSISFGIFLMIKIGYVEGLFIMFF